MLRAKLTSKGQVTVPVAVRKLFNLQPGDDLLFEIKPDGAVRVAAFKRRRLTGLYSALPATKPYPGQKEIREKVSADLARRVLRKGKEK